MRKMNKHATTISFQTIEHPASYKIVSSALAADHGAKSGRHNTNTATWKVSVVIGFDADHSFQLRAYAMKTLLQWQPII